MSRMLKHGVRIRRQVFNPPTIRVLLTQIAVATMDWVLAGVIPYVLLSHRSDLSYFSFLSVFLFAQILQIVSHVPGGVGVFEGSVLVLLKSEIPSSVLLASLLVYRFIYTLVPLLIAAPLFFIFEWRHSRSGLGKRLSR